MSSTQYWLGRYPEGFATDGRYSVRRNVLTMRGKRGEAWIGEDVEVCTFDIEAQSDRLVLSNCSASGMYEQQCQTPQVSKNSDVLECPQ
ncbi:hypothetical protein [Microvirga thermotolerans]|uniref:Uncharacterized protein n=1 Tax=Microvirga thermotolerans TaxID=2651334 RepID=A0A5P9JVH4_9HYPH|nr:hypothetical protein [Microvirga thermotolerans]QFU15175.1 hypothetical protein GDR74_02505 [Microvirga thermotolerans]